MRKALRRFRPDLDDALLVPGAIGLSVAVGGLSEPLWGLLVLSVLVLAAGVVASMRGAAG